MRRLHSAVSMAVLTALGEFCAEQIPDQPLRLKYWTARSCFSAAARVSNVPRFLRFPVFGSTLRE